jgi:hypothetical protein
MTRARSSGCSARSRPGSSESGETVLLRVFVHFCGAKIVLLLGGYDKGADPKERRQQREIAEARRLLTQFKERQRRDRTGRRRPMMGNSP